MKDFFRAAIIAVTFLVIQAELSEYDEAQVSTYAKD